MTTDIRNARFYVVDDDEGAHSHADAEPLLYERALSEAKSLVDQGRNVRVLYTEGATQLEITGFVREGIQAELVSSA